jgi:AcrR family transcriptional regulator
MMFDVSASKARTRYVPGPRRGDVRRDGLLRALDKLLAERPFADIGIVDITREAGVSRSAFYFYFPTKAAAVAALLADFQDDMRNAAVEWYEGGDATPLQRLQDGFEASIARWRQRAGLLVAMLDGIGTDADVRALWQTWTDQIIDEITTRIEADHAAGLISELADARALATVLMGAAVFAMERDVRAIAAGEAPSDALALALIQLWYRTLYAPLRD